jgi:hypothetical protein
MFINNCYNLEKKSGKKRIKKAANFRKVSSPWFLCIKILLIPIAFSISPVCSHAAGGSGTASNPYIIENCDELQKMKILLRAYYVLGDHIDCYDTIKWNIGNGFEPIESFTGYFDGNGYSITNLYINRPNTSGVGLFVDIERGSVIKNVSLKRADITGRYDTGGLVGRNSGTIANSYSTGSVNGTLTNVGGLVGLNSGKICSSHSTANVRNDWQSAGGLVGRNGGTIITSHATGNVSSAGDDVGGLVGSNFSGTIMGSYATGNVSGDNAAAGGLVGRNGYNNALISDCYATGNVSGGSGAYVRAGGLVGLNGGTGWGTEKITKCYSTGYVSGSQNIGGLVGVNANSDETITNSFWDVETSSLFISDGGIGKKTWQMKTISTFTIAGWDFNTIWDIDAFTNFGYPFIRWKMGTDECIGCTLPVGHLDYCRDCGPCAEGEGDCDNDGECQSGLTCDLVPGTDTCQPGGGCTLPVGHLDYCRDPDCGPCAEGEGDCDNDGECAGDLICDFVSGTDYCSAPTGCQLPVDDPDYCRDCGPCAEGEGDCDNKSECAGDLTCPQVPGTDTCQPVGGGCTLPMGHLDYCQECGPCAAGEGDCDNDSECQSGLTCDQVPGVDTCQKPTECQYPVGHLDYCLECGPCAAGQGDCDNNSECQSGLTCVQVTGTDVCCPHPIGHLDYCRDCGPCATGQGDCDNDGECQSGLSCPQVPGTDTCQ